MDDVAALGPVIWPTLDGSLWLWCVACRDLVRIETPDWSWDGAVIAPTVTPSILTRGHDTTGPTVCHAFIRGGNWQYLDDSTHHLAGRIVPMEPLPRWFVVQLTTAEAADG